MNEEFGGDYLGVTWRIPGGAEPVNGLEPIPMDFLRIRPPFEPQEYSLWDVTRPGDPIQLFLNNWNNVDATYVYASPAPEPWHLELVPNPPNDEFLLFHQGIIKGSPVVKGLYVPVGGVLHEDGFLSPIKVQSEGFNSQFFIRNSGILSSGSLERLLLITGIGSLTGLIENDLKAILGCERGEGFDPKILILPRTRRGSSRAIPEQSGLRHHDERKE